MHPAWRALLQNIELMPQDQDFSFELPSRLEAVAQRADEKKGNCHHRPGSCSDSVRAATQPDGVFGTDTAPNSRFNDIRCEEGERDRHVYFADATGLTFCDALCGCGCITGKFLEPTASPSNRRDQPGACFRADWTRVLRIPPAQEFHGAVLLPASARNLHSAFAKDCIRSGKFDKQLLPLNLNARDLTLDENPVIHWL